MQFSLSFFAVSIGAVVALSPLPSASAQSPPISASTALAEAKASGHVKPSETSGRAIATASKPAAVEIAQVSDPAPEAIQPSTDTELEAEVVESGEVSDPSISDAPTNEPVVEPLDAPNADSTDEPTGETAQEIAPGNTPASEGENLEGSSADEAEQSAPPDTAESDAPESDTSESNTSESNTSESDSSEPDSSEPESSEEAVPATDSEAGEASATGDLIQAAPDYLNPSPNPLQFPTRPEEVEIIGTQPITLEQAIDLALRNNRELQVTRLELEQSQAALRQSLAANLPTVDLSSSLNFQENTQSQDTGNLQDILDQLQGGQDSSQQQSTDDINVTLGGTLEVNYTLFTSGRRPALIEAAEGQVRFQELQVEAQEEQIRLDVINDYYDLQESDEQVRIQEAALEQASQSLRDAEALERAGVGTQFDVLQAQVDVANARQQVTQSLSQQQIARRQIVQTLSLAQSVDVAAADPVEVADLWDLSLEETIVLAIRNRAELEQQLVQREISDAQRRAALAQLGPQVSLFASYNVQDTLNENETVQDSYQFGAQFSLSLFDGGSARAQADQEETNIAIAETNFASQRNQIRFDIESAYSNLQANFENIQTASLALESARRALELARLRFVAGVGTQTDVLISQTDLTEAEFNRVQAILGYNRSLAQLQRSVSNLPYAGTVPAPSPDLQ